MKNKNTKWGLVTVLLLLFSHLTQSIAEAKSEKSSEQVELKYLELEREVWNAEPEDFSKLDKRVTRIIQLEPYSAFAHYLLAHLYVRIFADDPTDMSLLRRASELAQQSIEIDSVNDYGYIVIAEILDLMGQPENGLKALNSQQGDKKPLSWRNYFIRAKLQTDKLKVKDILDLLAAALDAPNSQREIITPYVVGILQTEYQDEALIHQLDSWNKRYPNDLFLQTKGIVLTGLNRYKEAHEVYRSIYLSNPAYKEAIINDAILLYGHLNNYKEAESLLLDVLTKFTGKMDKDLRSILYFHLGLANIKSKKFSNANQYFFLSISNSIDLESRLHLVVGIYQDKKLNTELLKLLNRLTNEVKGSGILYAILAETLSEQLNKYEEAVIAFNNAIILEPGRGDFYNGLGLVFYRMNRFSNALDQFKKATKIDPDDATARYNEACILARLGRSAEAISSLKEAINLYPPLQANAQTDQDFDSIKQMEAFRAIIFTSPNGTKSFEFNEANDLTH